MRTGIECEGIFSGTKTLFVYTKDFYTKDVLAEANRTGCTNIYFGADNQHLEQEDFERILQVRKKWMHLITVEIDYSTLINFRKNSLYNNINFIVRFKAEIDDLGPLDQIKIESNKNCYLATKQSFIKNEKNYLDFLIQG